MVKKPSAFTTGEMPGIVCVSSPNTPGFILIIIDLAPHVSSVHSGFRTQTDAVLSNVQQAVDGQSSWLTTTKNKIILKNT